MIEIELKDIDVIEDCEGTIMLRVDKGCTNQKLIVLKSDSWLQGAIVDEHQFDEGELLPCEDQIRLTNKV